MADDLKLNVSLQENLMTILAYDDKQGKIVCNLLDPSLMEGDYRIVAERAIQYWRRFGEAPKDHLADELADIIEDEGNKRARTFKRILHNIKRLSESINSKYVVERLRTFSRMQHIKNAVIKSAEQLNAQQEIAIEEVEKIWNNLLRTREIEFSAGLRLTDVQRFLDHLEQSQAEFPVGIKEMDRIGVGPGRGTLFFWLAPTGRGKTWALVHCGKHALMRRKKVVHISLEMSEEEVAQRYYQSLWSMSKRSETFEITTLDIEDHKLEGFKRETVEPEFSLQSEILRDELINHMDQFGRRFENLVIKRFPTRGVDVAGIAAYLDNLELTENFVADMLILDYAGILKTDSKNHRISLGREVEDLRGLGVKRNMAVVSAMQVSKEGAEALQVSQTHVAEDWSTIQTADGVATLSSTDAEFNVGLARLYINKFRGDRDRWGMLITQNYNMGQFCLQSVPFHFAMHKQVKAYIGEDEEEGGGSKKKRGFDDRDDEDDD